MRSKTWSIIGVPFLILAATIVVAVSSCSSNKKEVSTHILYIYPNSDFKEIVQELKSSEIVSSQFIFSALAKIKKLPKTIKQGRYELSSTMGYSQIINSLRLGTQTPHNLVIAGRINSVERLASIISKKIIYDSLAVLNELSNPFLIDSLGFNGETFIGMFLLNSYQIFWTTKPKALINRLHKEYQTFWSPERVEKANKLGLSPIEVITLASIVAEESNQSFEHPIIAGVYLNRIKIGMPLQADPTIRYTIRDREVNRILYSDLKIDSPYNTYKYRGLPPGPIVAVAPNVIDAVLNYTQHRYLYFCAKAELDGTHNFAVTFAEHSRNANAYRRAIREFNKRKATQ